jgi:predicted AAA+ superfamily ATPase
VAIFNLLPFSIQELKATDYYFPDYEDYLLRGFYPKTYDKKVSFSDWLGDYIQTYIERDVRKIQNIGNLYTFQQFLKLCAGHIGQEINMSGMGSHLGVSYHTVQSWLSILETSFIVFRLYPYYKNFNKRMVKSPKLYFYDSGLAAWLLGIKSKKELQFHYARGALFESMIISELFKLRLNKGRRPEFNYLKSHTAFEIDCIWEKDNNINVLEIKSGKTFSGD